MAERERTVLGSSATSRWTVIPLWSAVSGLGFGFWGLLAQRVGGLLALGVAAGIVGMGEGLILRGRVRAAPAWLAATAGGAILGSLAGVAFAARVEPLLGLRSGVLNGYLIPFVGLVVLPGLLQSLVLRPSVRVGGWWLLARGLAAIVMYLGFAGAYWTVNLVSGHPGHHYAPADGEVAICSTVAGVAFGLVSGAALGRLLRHGSRRSGERRAGRPAQV